MNHLKCGLSPRKVLMLFVLIPGCFIASVPLFGWQEVVQRWKPRKVPPNAEFVGDGACATCHKSKATTYSQSGMAMAMQSAAESRVLAANPLMAFRSGPYSYEIKRKDKQSFYTVTDGKETISLPILYAFGQGKAGQTYILQHEGAFYESRVSFFRQLGGLDFTIGHPRTVPLSLKQAFGRRLSDAEALDCFGCHSIGGVRGREIHLDKLTPGVRCEACHGPGARHATASYMGEPPDGLIFNPGQLGGDELTQAFCAACHQGSNESGLTRMTEINAVRYQPFRIFHSKCYSDDRRISCTACHNPHEALKQDAAYYDRQCLACHASKGNSTGTKATEHSHSLVAACPVGTKDCASCHMPKLEVAEAHFKFTDHYIRVVRPKEPATVSK